MLLHAWSFTSRKVAKSRGPLLCASRTLVTCTTIAQLRSELKARKAEKNEAISFIPTMGALHAGHISLVNEAKRYAKEKQEKSCIVTSIFVNATQFAANEDLSTYPRTIEKDRDALIEAGVDVLFLPEHETMYPDKGGIVHVEPSGLDQSMEALARPSFFRGVATIVTKLFNIVQPDSVYFGQKDAGQCVLIKNLVQDLNMPIDVVIVETLRENDGLAMSSRNGYLTGGERAVADILYKALSSGKNLFNEGCTDPTEIAKAVREILGREPMVARVEYISLASPMDMKEIGESDKVEVEGAILSSAIKLGNVRLIDNVLLGQAESWTQRR